MANIQAYPRFIESEVREILLDTPVVLIHGARQCGKTTLACVIGRDENYEYVSFDDNNTLSSAQSDPIGFIARLGDKVILDEIQRVPALFAAIKLSVDENRQPGRFILTGSANLLAFPQLSDSLAGRMEVVHLRPLARTEMAARPVNLFHLLFSGEFEENLHHFRLERLAQGLADAIVMGGYPSAVTRKSFKRMLAWYQQYINMIIQRDVQEVAQIRHLDIVPKLIKLVAGQTSRLFNGSKYASPFSISRPTILEYLTILEQLFLIERLQPWFTNRLSQLIKSPKVHMSDTGLACALLGVTSQKLWSDRALFGQLVETFVYQELKKYSGWHDQQLLFYHFRDKLKYEVDIVVEQGLQYIGIEVKAAATVELQDFRGLSRMRQALEDQFVLGIVMYDGDKVLPFGDRMLAAPVSVLIPTMLHLNDSVSQNLEI
jgi:predicted AAA+ superfamily ATPase